MPDQLIYAIEVFFNGLMAGVLYALVALGFVLIYKASGIFNYAQGVMALFAAMTLVGVMEGQVPFAHLINAVLGTKVAVFSNRPSTIKKEFVNNFPRPRTAEDESLTKFQQDILVELRPEVKKNIE